MLTFLPLQRFLDQNATQSLIALFDQAARSTKSALQSKQNAVHRDWLKKGSVPQTELMFFSNSLGPTPQYQRFISFLAAGLVGSLDP